MTANESIAAPRTRSRPHVPLRTLLPRDASAHPVYSVPVVHSPPRASQAPGASPTVRDLRASQKLPKK